MIAQTGRMSNKSLAQVALHPKYGNKSKVHGISI